MMTNQFWGILTLLIARAEKVMSFKPKPEILQYPMPKISLKYTNQLQELGSKLTARKHTHNINSKGDLRPRLREGSGNLKIKDIKLLKLNKGREALA